MRYTVDVVICTYRRPSLAATLRSVAAQALPARCVVRVIVADNDDTPSARALAEQTAAECSLALTYIHAPARNISVARNACLDAATAPLIAFLDDDEVAAPGWLAALLMRMEVTGAAIVLGPAVASYPDGVAHWVQAADLHSTRPVVAAGRIRTGYTCNVLVRADCLAGERFDPRLGRSGGEDDVFFAHAAGRGCLIAYAPDAVVTDPVPPARATLRWLMRRSFRNGQTYARIMLDRREARLPSLVIAAAKGAACAGLAVVSLISPVRWRRAVVRSALHWGAAMRLAGLRDIEIY